MLVFNNIIFTLRISITAWRVTWSMFFLKKCSFETFIKRSQTNLCEPWYRRHNCMWGLDRNGYQGSWLGGDAGAGSVGDGEGDVAGIGEQLDPEVSAWSMLGGGAGFARVEGDSGSDISTSLELEDCNSWFSFSAKCCLHFLEIQNYLTNIYIYFNSPSIMSCKVTNFTEKHLIPWSAKAVKITILTLKTQPSLTDHTVMNTALPHWTLCNEHKTQPSLTE